MWWCCGKIGKETLGCKFSKHVHKEDDDEDDDQDAKDKSKASLLKSTRCQCCKELGHTMETCYRDPNLKTNQEVDEDIKRIQTIKDNRKLFADSSVTTTHFLNKLSKVPRLDETMLKPNKSNEDELAKAAIKQKINSFQRGSMNFDDYNYDLYNKYILIDPERDENDDKKVDLGSFVPQTVKK